MATTTAVWRMQLRRSREARGLTHGALAKLARPPLSASAISKIESGHLNPTMKTVESLCQVLECDVDLKPRNHSLHTAYRHQAAANLAAEHRQAVIALMEAVLDSIFGPIEKG